ncbi:MAG TPA: glycosyltransferase family 2 protein [Solirubrobacterales bacterium]|jgi:GT2 family glycosyltransferase|nr:glycosyltransferase family 2 protein [Solirubrobacterales bacterium]
MLPTIYIPTLRAGERLARTLSALESQQPRPEVVVADNSSEGLGASLVRERFPWVRVATFGENLGFGKALNRAVREQPGDPIVFLNDDVTVEPGFVSGLLEAFAADVEMVAAVLLRERDPGRIDSAGVVADRTLLGFDYLSGEPVGALAGAADPLGPTGGAALYRRAAFERVGGFDEGIFLYYEDLDLALRMHLAGARCRLAPDARGLHAYSETLGANTARKYAMTGWSRGYLLRTYGFGRRPRLLARAVAADGAICAGQILTERTAQGLRGRLRGWRAGREAPRRHIPSGVLLDISLREALALRRRRHSS